MHKKLGIILIAGLSLLLTGCSKVSLSTTAKTYSPDEMVAVVKGHTANHNTVTYQIDNGTKHSVKVHDKTFVIQVPASDQQQKVKITVAHAGQQQQQTVTVNAAKKLGNYQQIVQKYNQMVVMSKLSPQEVQTLRAASALKKAPSVPNPQLMQQMKQAQQVEQKVQQLQSTTKSEQLPAQLSGIHNVVDNSAYTLRLNVQNGNLMGATMMIPVKSFKDKAQAQHFGTAFALFSQALGANGKQVMHEFESKTKNQDKTQTTSKTIINHGIKYSIGFSTTELYVYITKG
ncbi:hypothetical protein [Ligilactobacillus aviarius]|uniref:hypothetical protein n=1 Tax=Ligilactobacillus aviarius TaxID=1606 RepID=UPI0024B9A128|nr:hypothetical protein [Ligilactobacillus aviarius]